jgi:hypothetical protein
VVARVGTNPALHGRAGGHLAHVCWVSPRQRYVGCLLARVRRVESRPVRAPAQRRSRGLQLRLPEAPPAPKSWVYGDGAEVVIVWFQARTGHAYVADEMKDMHLRSRANQIASFWQATTDLT